MSVLVEVTKRNIEEAGTLKCLEKECRGEKPITRKQSVC